MTSVNNHQVLNFNQPKAETKATKANAFSAAQNFSSIDTLGQQTTSKGLGFSTLKQKKNFLYSFWDFLKSFFVTQKQENEDQEPSTKLFIDNPEPKSSFSPNVVLYDRFIDLDFIGKNKDKYIFILSGNQEARGGRYGQSALLRPALEKYPESIVELPVTRSHANILDPSTLREVSLREDRPEDLVHNIKCLDSALNDAIQRSKSTGKTIFLLKGGYGTGAARMYAFAPKSFKALNKLFEKKLGVRYLLDPLRVQYSLEYVDEIENQDARVKLKQGYSDQFDPEQISKDLWSNGWALNQNIAA